MELIRTFKKNQCNAIIGTSSIIFQGSVTSQQFVVNVQATTQVQNVQSSPEKILTSNQLITIVDWSRLVQDLSIKTTVKEKLLPNRWKQRAQKPASAVSQQQADTVSNLQSDLKSIFTIVEEIKAEFSASSFADLKNLLSETSTKSNNVPPSKRKCLPSWKTSLTSSSFFLGIYHKVFDMATCWAQATEYDKSSWPITDKMALRYDPAHHRFVSLSEVAITCPFRPLIFDINLVIQQITLQISMEVNPTFSPW